jgi:hypothetical protein
MRSVKYSVPFGILYFAAPAAADAPPDGLVAAPVESVAAPRPWLYLDDPRTPEQLSVVAFSRLTYTGVGASPTRPFASETARPGGVGEIGGEIGLVSFLSAQASAFAGTGYAPSAGTAGGMAGLRFSPFAKSGATHASASAGWIRGLDGKDGAWARVAFAQDVGRVRLGTMVHGERIFAPGRDALDLMLTAGASYAVAGPLRLGGEYVGQDLEGALDGDEAEGGVRHFLGPTAAVDLVSHRLSLALGPSFGLSKGSPPVAGRLAIAWAF